MYIVSEPDFFSRFPAVLFFCFCSRSGGNLKTRPSSIIVFRVLRWWCRFLSVRDTAQHTNQRPTRQARSSQCVLLLLLLADTCVLSSPLSSLRISSLFFFPFYHLPKWIFFFFIQGVLCLGGGGNFLISQPGRIRPAPSRVGSQPWIFPFFFFSNPDRD